MKQKYCELACDDFAPLDEELSDEEIMDMVEEGRRMYSAAYQLYIDKFFD